jgi:tetratricopeptide (TPR) repeat protein
LTPSAAKTPEDTRLKSALQVEMQCKLSEAVIFVAGPRFVLGFLCRSLLAAFLTFTLFAYSPAAYAQAPSDEGTDVSISGTVFFQGDNRPAAQVAVSLRSHDAGIFRSVLTDYDGRFEVRGLAPGTYEFTIEEQGYETLHSTARLDAPSLKVEFHLIPSMPPPSPQSANTVSVRELMIPGKAREEYRKGLVSLAKKELVQSLKHFTSAVRAFPGYFEAFYHQGVVETNLGHQKEAMEAFQTAVNLSGGRYARAQFGIGYIYYLQGNAADAEAITRKGLEMDPNSADGYVILGMSLLRQNRLDEAERSAREALLRNPNEADAYLVLADTCARKQNYQEQIQDLDAYLRLTPNGLASQHVHEVREVVQRILNKNRAQNQAH